MGILHRIGHYSVAKAMIMAAGFVSYPILTRVLEPGEYGYMGLIIGLLNLTIGVSKLGLQFSTVRLWSQRGDTEQSQRRFVLSFFVATLAASICVMALYNLGAVALTPYIGDELALFIMMASPLILIRALQSFGLALLQAQERSKAYAIFEMAIAYAAMILAVLGAAVVIGGLAGYYIGLITGEALVIVVMMVYTLRTTRALGAGVDLPLVKEGVTFGLPMAIYEMSGVLFYNGDRFIILWLLDKVWLGYYTVAHNLSMYIHVAFGYPVTMAVTPAVTSLYEKEGPEAASAFLRTAARWFFLFSLAAVAGMTMIRTDLIELLASTKFVHGADLVPILLAGLLLSGARDILGAGIFLKKRPWRLAGLNFGGAALNAGLNILLIHSFKVYLGPDYAIQGAPVATLLSQLVITCVVWYLGSRLVTVTVDVPALLLHALCAAGMVGALYMIDPGPGLLRLLLRLPAGALVFGGLLLMVDREARTVAGGVLAKLRRRL